LWSSVWAGVYSWYLKFFRNRLLNLDVDGINDLIDKTKKEAEDITIDTLRMVWYMRGGVTYEEAWFLSYQARKYINDIIKENLDVTRKSGIPFF